MEFGALVTEDGIFEAVKGGEDESCRVSRLVNLSILHVVFQNLDTAEASENFLVVTTVLANVRQDVEGELTNVERAGLGLVLDQVEEGLHQTALHQFDLEKIKEGCRHECHEDCLSPRDVLETFDEGSKHLVAANLVEMLGHEAHQVRDDIEAVNLELKKLRWRPPRDHVILLDRLWVKVEQECPQEMFLHHDVVSLHVFAVMAD